MNGEGKWRHSHIEWPGNGRHGRISWRIMMAPTKIVGVPTEEEGTKGAVVGSTDSLRRRVGDSATGSQGRRRLAWWFCCGGGARGWGIQLGCRCARLRAAATAVRSTREGGQALGCWRLCATAWRRPGGLGCCCGLTRPSTEGDGGDPGAVGCAGSSLDWALVQAQGEVVRPLWGLSLIHI